MNNIAEAEIHSPSIRVGLFNIYNRTTINVGQAQTGLQYSEFAQRSHNGHDLCSSRAGPYSAVHKLKWNQVYSGESVITATMQEWTDRRCSN